MRQNSIYTLMHEGKGSLDSNCSLADGFTRMADAEMEFQMI
jgi:hypothetical protein